MDTEITGEHLDRHVPTRLRTRVRIYVGISALIIAVIVYRLIVDGTNPLYPTGALLVGLLVGIVVSRMYLVSWDKDAEKVISRIDVYGVAFLLCYIAFEVFGEHLIRQWFSGPQVLTVILSLAGGAVLGRGLGMYRKIYQVLRENI